jgi:myo-inositol-1(or 4)-monophosphatase
MYNCFMDRFSLAKALVIKAGKLILKWYGKENEIIEKGEKDFTLTADLEAEKLLLDEINKYFPDDSILSEEAGDFKNGSEYRWIIDPLDGTANFKANIPYFCTTMAIEMIGQIVVSVVYDPIHNNLFSAQRGQNAFLNGNQIYVSSESNINNFLISYSTSNHKSAEVIDLGAGLYRNVLHNCRAIRLQGSSILDLCHVAMGTFDGLIKVGANYWDFAPGCLIVEEAGGIVTSLSSDSWNRETNNIVASNNSAHNEFLKILLA